MIASKIDLSERTRIAKRRTAALQYARRVRPLYEDEYDDDDLPNRSHAISGNARRVHSEYGGKAAFHLLHHAARSPEEQRNVEQHRGVLGALTEDCRTASSNDLCYLKMLPAGTNDWLRLQNAGLDATFQRIRTKPEIVKRASANRIGSVSWKDWFRHDRAAEGRLRLISGSFVPNNISRSYLCYFKTRIELLATSESLADPKFPCNWIALGSDIYKEKEASSWATEYPSLVFGKPEIRPGRSDYFEVVTTVIVFTEEFRYLAAIMREVTTLHYQEFMAAMNRILDRLTE